MHATKQGKYPNKIKTMQFMQELNIEKVLPATMCNKNTFHQDSICFDSDSQ